jgi:hypothetical protein
MIAQTTLELLSSKFVLVQDILAHVLQLIDRSLPILVEESMVPLP